MIIQLNPHVPVTTPKGKGLAHFITDNGIEHDLLWTVFIDSTGECWTYSNREIRAQKNITAGRTKVTPFYDPEDMAFSRYHDDMETDYCGECDDAECNIQQELLSELDRSLIDESREMYEKTQQRLGQIEQQLQHQSYGLQNVYDTFNELENKITKLGATNEKENIDEGYGKEGRTRSNEEG